MPRGFSACVAEFIGTFALVFFGACSIVLTHDALGGHGGLLSIALAHGLVLSVMISACAALSGAQFNPAVSIALLLIGKQGPARTGAFVLTQLIAAAAAAALLQWVLTPEIANAPSVRLGATIGALTDQGRSQAVLVLEILASFALMTSILMGTIDPRAPKLGGFTIGLTVAAMILAIGPLTGASMNPARTFGPALIGGHWDMAWIYWAGPVLGAAAAAVVYKLFWEPEEK